MLHLNKKGKVFLINHNQNHLIMRKFSLLTIFALLAVTMTSCELVGDIFEAGMWVGIIIVALVIALIIWIIRKVS